jgi:hypothetical protein
LIKFSSTVFYDVLASQGRQQENGLGVVDLAMNFSSRIFSQRLWEIRVTQIPFSERAPAGCLQYFTGTEGLIQVFDEKYPSHALSLEN